METVIDTEKKNVLWKDEQGTWHDDKIEELIKYKMGLREPEKTHFYYDHTEELFIGVTNTIQRSVYRCAYCKQRADGHAFDISKMRYCPYCGRRVREFRS